MTWTYKRLHNYYSQRPTRKGVTFTFGHRIFLRSNGDIAIALQDDEQRPPFIVSPADVLRVEHRDGRREQYVFETLTGFVIVLRQPSHGAKWAGRELYDAGKQVAQYNKSIAIKLGKQPEVLAHDGARELVIDEDDLKVVRRRYQALRNAVRTREKLGMKFHELVDKALAASGKKQSWCDEVEREEISRRVMSEVTQFQDTQEWEGDRIVSLLSDMCRLHGSWKHVKGHGFLGWPERWGKGPRTAQQLVETWWRSGRRGILRSNGAAQWRELPGKGYLDLRVRGDQEQGAEATADATLSPPAALP